MQKTDMVRKQNRLGQGVTNTISHLRSLCKPLGALARVGRDSGPGSEAAENGIEN